MSFARQVESALRLPHVCGSVLALLSLGLGCGSQGGEAGTSHGGTPNESGGAALGGTPPTLAGSGGLGGSTASGGAGGAAASDAGGASGVPNGGGTTVTGGALNTGGVTAVGGAQSGAGGATVSRGGSAGTGTGGGNAGVSSAGAAAGGSDSYHPCPSNGSACKIMPFGDSITDGFGTIGSYRLELFRLAHQAGKNITFVGTGMNGPPLVDGVAFPPNHEGHSGFTIDNTPSRSGISPLVVTVMPQFTPHIVTLMIGTNDAIDSYDLANAPNRLGALIDSIFAKLPNVLLVVAQIIPSQDDALNGRIQTYNAAIPALIKTRADAGKHLLLVDMYAPFAAVANYKTLLLKDTWHPNAAGDVILGARWYSVLTSSL